jgi:hypothetical protein
MKKILLALAVGATAFGSIYGLAASLGVGSDTLGSGTAAVAACQAVTSPVNVTYAPTYTAGDYQTTSVKLTGLTSACYNKNVFITVTGTGALASAPVSVTGVTGSTGTTASFTVAALASEVTGVNVAVAG